MVTFFFFNLFPFLFQCWLVLHLSCFFFLLAIRKADSCGLLIPQASIILLLTWPLFSSSVCCKGVYFSSHLAGRFSKSLKARNGLWLSIVATVGIRGNIS